MVQVSLDAQEPQEQAQTLLAAVDPAEEASGRAKQPSSRELVASSSPDVKQRLAITFVAVVAFLAVAGAVLSLSAFQTRSTPAEDRDLLQPCRLLPQPAPPSTDGAQMLQIMSSAISMRMPQGGSSPCQLPSPGDLECSTLGENCAISGCCQESGHQCFWKNFSFAYCLPSCTAGDPNMLSSEPGKWRCERIGERTPGKSTDRPTASAPNWVAEACAKPGDNCTSQRCCAVPGQQCYEQESGYGDCMWNCAEGVHLFDERLRTWSCVAVGPRTPGARKVHEHHEHEKLPNWVAEDCAKQGEDCSGPTCCAAPGTQCFRKDEERAECLVSCPSVPDIFSNDPHEADPWSCEALGPRTPGLAPTTHAHADAADAELRTYSDLPSWVSQRCSRDKENCAGTRCCHSPDRVCFEQEEGKAFCHEHCLEGMVVHGKNWTCKELGPRTPVKCPKCAAKSLSPPDIVIPFFERDLCKLKYTAKALGTNDPHHFLGNVFLMWVSSNGIWEYQDQIDEVLDHIRSGSRNASVVDFTQRMEQAGMAGWHAQQMVKLKAASLVESEFYVVLDSKNTLIKKLSRSPFFTQCNQGIIQAEFSGKYMGMPHSEWYDLSAEALGVKSPKDDQWPESLLWPSSITPMVMHRESVLNMLEQLGEGSDIEELCDGALCEQIGAFSSSGHGATEFTLYTLYVYNMMTSHEFECIHTVDPIMGFQIEYSKHWLNHLQAKIIGSGLRVYPEEMAVTDKDGWPLDWSMDDTDAVPKKGLWPLFFSDLTRKWSAALWRGEPEQAAQLVQQNLNVLSEILDGSKMSPLMFGSQPASLGSMNATEEKEAIRDIIKLYKRSHLLAKDEKVDEEKFIGCVVGYHN